MTEVTKNYTDEMVEQMTAAYTTNPTRDTVDAIAAEFNKPVRSVISKLSALGVYQRQEVAVTKAGAPVVLKEVIVAQVQAVLGQEFPSLGKMTKADLERLFAVLAAA